MSVRGSLLTWQMMLEPGQRMRPSMRLRAVCSEWLAIIPMMVKYITRGNHEFCEWVFWGLPLR